MNQIAEKIIISRKTPKYIYAGKINFLETLKGIFPWEFKNSKKTAYILGYLFLAALIFGVIDFMTTSNFLKGDISHAIEVGVPWTFLEFSLEDPTKQPVRTWALIGSLLLYTLIAYIINILISYLGDKIFKSRKEKEVKPKVFKNIKSDGKVTNSLSNTQNELKLKVSPFTSTPTIKNPAPINITRPRTSQK